MPHSPPQSALPLDEMIAFIDTVFPEINHGGRSYSIEAVGPGTCRLRLHYHPRHLRPGGTLSGPSMMALADLALYVAVLSVVGKVELAVTTNLSINFLSKPEKADLIAECRILKAGKRLCVGEVSLFSENTSDLTAQDLVAHDLVAHVTGTYSVPPQRN
jgi:uncharacterized protein (TIGR00369 family)